MSDTIYSSVRGFPACRAAPGLVDLNVGNGGVNARVSIHAASGRRNAVMSVSCANGDKDWLNSGLIIREANDVKTELPVKFKTTEGHVYAIERKDMPLEKIPLIQLPPES